jgi:hypothetical protein
MLFNCKMAVGIAQFVLCDEYYYADQIRKDELEGACGTHEQDLKNMYMYKFSRAR